MRRERYRADKAVVEQVGVRGLRQTWLRKLGRHVGRIGIVLVLGGFVGATLARLAPGYGTDEAELDSRLSQSSKAALLQQNAGEPNLAVFYGRYWMQLLHGDLGVSPTLHQPVRQLLAERLPETCRSVALGLVLAWTAGLGLAMIAILRRGAIAGWAASLIASILLCIPAAVLALLFLMVRAPDRLVVGGIVYPTVFRYARELLARAAAMPHVLTARAKGAGEVRILVRHVLAVAAPQLLALGAVSISVAFAAAIPVEVLCDRPGIGQLAWQAAMGRDLVLLVNLTLLVTLLTLGANLLAEVAGQKRTRGAS